jgi:hypothetical protein
VRARVSSALRVLLCDGEQNTHTAERGQVRPGKKGPLRNEALVPKGDGLAAKTNRAVKSSRSDRAGGRRRERGKEGRAGACECQPNPNQFNRARIPMSIHSLTLCLCLRAAVCCACQCAGVGECVLYCTRAQSSSQHIMDRVPRPR